MSRVRCGIAAVADVMPSAICTVSAPRIGKHSRLNGWGRASCLGWRLPRFYTETPAHRPGRIGGLARRGMCCHREGPGCRPWRCVLRTIGWTSDSCSPRVQLPLNLFLQSHRQMAALMWDCKSRDRGQSMCGPRTRCHRSSRYSSSYSPMRHRRSTKTLSRRRLYRPC